MVAATIVRGSQNGDSYLRPYSSTTLNLLATCNVLSLCRLPGSFRAHTFSCSLTIPLLLFIRLPRPKPAHSVLGRRPACSYRATFACDDFRFCISDPFMALRLNGSLWSAAGVAGRSTCVCNVEHDFRCCDCASV